MFVFCMYVRLLFDIDTFADDGDSGLMKYSNLVVNTLQYFLSEIWPKIGKNHHRGSFNNPTVMALWLTRKLQHYYELHQNSAQMIS